MPKLKPQEDPAASAEAKTDKPAQATSRSVEEDAAVDIPLEDVTIPNYSDEVQKLVLERARLNAEAQLAQDTWSRSSERQKGETPEEHQERIKHEFQQAVLAVRRQEAAPPPPPQPVPRAISEQTAREMAAGAKQSEYWREQAKQRPLPTAKELKAEGTNTPVFRPGEYAHEKGGVDKSLVTQTLPTR